MINLTPEQMAWLPFALAWHDKQMATCELHPDKKGKFIHDLKKCYRCRWNIKHKKDPFL